MMKKRISIAGATGYAGGELAAILARHRSAEVVGVSSSASGGGAKFASLHPSLRGVAGPAVTPYSVDDVLASQPDVVFLATPNEISAETVPTLVAHGIRVIDLSGSFRLTDKAVYPQRYGFEHPAPDLLGETVYGLTEYCNGELATARLVANPGCYPTAILLALRPLTALFAEGSTIICDAKSGVSGAGKKAELEYSFTELSGNFKAYGVGTHRHEPEITSRLGATGIDLIFVPHLLPIPRGILATIYVELSDWVTIDDIETSYQTVYGNSQFVTTHPHGMLPEVKDVVGTPYCEIGFSLLDRRRLIIVSVIDNLLKGAASQAVQNFNRMFDFPEEEGLV